MEIKQKLKAIWHNHTLMMVLCCAIPLALLGVFYALGYSSYAVWLVILLCPLLHFMMMRGHGHGDHGEDAGTPEENGEKINVTDK